MGRKYDEQKRSRAGTAALLRGAVAGYIVFLGYKIITNKETSMSVMTSRILGGCFIAAALGFGAYTFLRWKKDMEAAVISDEIVSVEENGEDN